MSNVPPQFQPDPPAPSPAPSDPAPDPGAAASQQSLASLPAHDRSGRAGWPPWLSIAGFAAGYGSTIVLGLVVIVIAGAFGVSAKDPPPGINIGLTVGQNLALVGAAYFFAFLNGRPAGSDFGLRPAPLWRSVRLLVAVWVGFFVLSAIWAAAWSLDQQQTLPDELGANGPLINALAVIVLVTVIAPLGEELFFRGFFFGALRNWHGPVLAAVLTGALFGLIHAGSAPVGYLVPLAIFGAGLCLLYELTGSLYPAIALHALNNSIALGANLKYDVGIVVAMMIGSTIAALLVARLLARAIGERRPAQPASAPAPEPA
jgi:membrane protease YdiL (CAAX protease family)